MIISINFGSFEPFSVRTFIPDQTEQIMTKNDTNDIVKLRRSSVTPTVHISSWTNPTKTLAGQTFSIETFSWTAQCQNLENNFHRYYLLHRGSQDTFIDFVFCHILVVAISYAQIKGIYCVKRYNEHFIVSWRFAWPPLLLKCI